MIFQRLVFYLTLMAIFQPLANAQSSVTPDDAKSQTPVQQSKEKKEQKELERKALAFLEEIISDGLSLKLVENRIFILTTAATVIWKNDEARARDLLREAMNQYYAMGQPDWQDRNNLFDNYISTRTYLLQLLASRDPKLALEFLRTTRQQIQTAKSNLTKSGIEYDDELEMNLAVRMAENDPQLALQIGEESLSKGLNQRVMEIWSSLQKKDPRLANRLSTQIIGKLKNAEMLKSYEASSIAFTMISDLRMRIADALKSEKGNTQLLAEMQHSYRELLDVIASSVLKLTTANLLNVQEQTQARGLLERAHSLLPEIEKNLPSRYTAVRAKLNQFNNAFYQPATLQEGYESLQNKSVDELIEMAAKAKPEMKEFIYRQALNKAVADGDADRAKQIAADQLGETLSLEPVLQQLEEQKIQRAAEQGKFDEARQSLLELKNDDEKARALVAMARQAGAKDNKKLQRELLDEAYGLFGSQMETRQQISDQLQLAITYLPVNPERGFEILESATDKLNAVLSAFILIDSFEQGGKFKDGEMRLSSVFFTTGLIDNLDALMAGFAQKNFERTRSTLQHWQIPEVRLMMSLAVIEKILNEKDDGRKYPLPKEM